MLTAITRPVSPAIVGCELTHLQRTPIDPERAQAQHEAYEASLMALGCTLERLPLEPDLPDSVFVEDTAVVLDELAVITRPGAASRRAETASVAAALARHRPLAHVAAPCTLDGGDVLRLGSRLLVGATPRTSAAGIRALAEIVAPHGFRVEAVPVGGCLHLKSAVTQVGPDTVLLNPAWVAASHFAGWRTIAVDPTEPHAANALLASGRVVFPAAHPRTAARLEEIGARLVIVDVSELAKAEAGVTCCSLIF